LKHYCHWPGCKIEVAPSLWGCKPHWFKLPKYLRAAIWTSYVPGQEITKTPSREYIVAATLVRGWILKREKAMASVYFCYSCTGWSTSDVACTCCSSTNLKRRETKTMGTTVTTIPKKVAKKLRKIIKDEKTADKVLRYLLDVWPESTTIPDIEVGDPPIKYEDKVSNESDKEKAKKKKGKKEKKKKGGVIDEFPSTTYSKGDMVLVKFESGRPKKCEVVAVSSTSGKIKVVTKASGDERIIEPDQITGVPK